MPQRELITVEGKPLSEYVKEMEEQEEVNRQRLKGMKIAHHRKDIMHEQDSTRYYDVTDKVTPKTRFKKYQKNSRVVKLSDDRIRKEYGIMSKQYQSMVKNILWIMIEEGPITSKGIAAKLGKKRKQLTGTISDVKKSLGEKHMKTEMLRGLKGRPLTYHIVDISLEDAYRLYRDYVNAKRKPVHTKVNQPDPAPKEKTTPLASQADDPSKLVGQITEYIEGRLKDIGMNVNVTGRIDVVFSIGDGAKMNMEVKPKRSIVK
jgi:hypothetical protein